MKRLLSLILAALMLAAALTSCAVPSASASLNANIRVTSSDALDAAAWLDARLGERLTDRVVIGTDASEYDVNVDTLESDGYVIRAIGDEVALFANDPEGLDRAVRKYAKMVEAGAVTDATYHEGARIKKLLLAGNDISTFAVRVDGDNKYVRDWVTSELAGYFCDLIGMATGFTPVLGGEAEHCIILRHVPVKERPDFKESSYNYHFEDGDLVIEFVDLYGAKNGALMFLQEECGWIDLAFGYDVLEEADLIDIPADLNVTKHLTLPGGVDQSCLRNPYSSLRKVTGTLSDTTYTGCALTNRNYKIPSAHHAIGNDWVKDYGLAKTKHFACLTDDEVFETIVEEITAHIKKRLAAGQEIGDAMAHIDLGMEDGNVGVGNTFCKCKDCQAVYADEGNTWAGPMIRFANRVEEAVDKAGYDGIKYSVFAYVGTQMPPKKTAPNDDLYVTIVLHDSCDKHFLDGSQCTTNSANKWMLEWNRSYTHGERAIINNVDWAKWIRDWHAMGTHLYVRMATLSNVMRPFMTMYTQYENMKFFAENEVMAIYNETYAFDGLDFNYLVGELYQILQFHPELSREEYYAEFERLLEKYYGDNWYDMFALCDLLRKAEIGESCNTAWDGEGTGIQYSAEYFCEHWDKMLAYADNAIKGARSALEERFGAFAKCIVLNMGCRSTYKVYGAKGAEFAAASERWNEMVALLAKWGHPIVESSEGNAIFFTANETGYWPDTRPLEPTLEAQLELW